MIYSKPESFGQPAEREAIDFRDPKSTKAFLLENLSPKPQSAVPSPPEPKELFPSARRETSLPAALASEIKADVFQIAFASIESAALLTKSVTLDPSGNVKKTSAPALTRGLARRVALRGTASEIATQFASHLRGISASQAIICAPPAKDECRVVAAEQLGQNPDAIARTRDHFRPTLGPALLGLDFDTAEFPPTLKAEIDRLGGLKRALAAVHPPFANAASVTRASASSGISIDAGVAAETGLHCYFVVDDGSRIEDFVKALADRVMLAGLLWGKITKTGAVLPRTIFDVAASSDPSRLFFEADALLEDTRLSYAAGARNPVVRPGAVLDTSSMKPLSGEDRTALDAKIAALKASLGSQASEQRQRWEDEHIARLTSKGVDAEAARRKCADATQQSLSPEWEIRLDDGALVTVADILAQPETFHNKRCADPLEPDYGNGRNVAIIYTDKNAPNIFSHAHGGVRYTLKQAAAEKWFDTATDGESIFGTSDRPAPDRPPLDWRRPRDWSGKSPPAREFVVKDLLPDHEVALLYGDGGVGKTLLAQQLATHIATGTPFLGHEVSKRKVMLFLCEDDENELWRRQIDINRSLGVVMDDIDPNMRIVSRKFQENLLAIWDRNSNTMKRTAMLRALLDDIAEFGATFVVVDTIADTYGGNEIDRAQVRQFIQNCLGKIVQDTGAAVLALGHPSRSGMASGDGSSGSSSWHNSVRARLYFTRPKSGNSPKTADDLKSPIRYLTNKKLNYGPAGGQIAVQWRNGCFELLDTAVDGLYQNALTPSLAGMLDALKEALSMKQPGAGATAKEVAVASKRVHGVDCTEANARTQLTKLEGDSIVKNVGTRGRKMYVIVNAVSSSIFGEEGETED